MIANDSVKFGKFGIVPLCSNHKHVSVGHNALIDKLLGAMKDRLVVTAAFGNVGTSAEYLKLFDQVSVLFPAYWPQHVNFNYGIEVRSLCDRFGLARCVTVSAFQGYADSQGIGVSDEHQPLLKCCSCIPVSSAECERWFNLMNLVAILTKNRFLIDRI